MEFTLQMYIEMANRSKWINSSCLCCGTAANGNRAEGMPNVFRGAFEIIGRLIRITSKRPPGQCDPVRFVTRAGEGELYETLMSEDHAIVGLPYTPSQAGPCRDCGAAAVLLSFFKT